MLYLVINSIKKNLFIYFFGIFFLVTLFVNVFFVYISQKTWQGVVIEDSYKRGLNYDEVIKEHKIKQQ